MRESYQNALGNQGRVSAVQNVTRRTFLKRTGAASMAVIGAQLAPWNEAHASDDATSNTLKIQIREAVVHDCSHLPIDTSDVKETFQGGEACYTMMVFTETEWSPNKAELAALAQGTVHGYVVKGLQTPASKAAANKVYDWLFLTLCVYVRRTDAGQNDVAIINRFKLTITAAADLKLTQIGVPIWTIDGQAGNGNPPGIGAIFVEDWIKLRNSPAGTKTTYDQLALHFWADGAWEASKDITAPTGIEDDSVSGLQPLMLSHMEDTSSRIMAESVEPAGHIEHPPLTSNSTNSNKRITGPGWFINCSSAYVPRNSTIPTPQANWALIGLDHTQLCEHFWKMDNDRTPNNWPTDNLRHGTQYDLRTRFIYKRDESVGGLPVTRIQYDSAIVATIHYVTAPFSNIVVNARTHNQSHYAAAWHMVSGVVVPLWEKAAGDAQWLYDHINGVEPMGEHTKYYMCQGTLKAVTTKHYTPDYQGIVRPTKSFTAEWNSKKNE